MNGARVGRLLLVVAAAALWAAGRLTWVLIRSADGLGQPRQFGVTGAAWSTALTPLAILALAAAIATIAVHGWALRVLAVLLAVTSLVPGYLGVSLWAASDVTLRGAAIADIPVMSVVGSERHHAGAVLTVMAALGILVSAVLLLRTVPAPSAGTDKYAAPAARRSTQQRDHPGPSDAMSERMIWDALDDGRDPTDSRSGGEGR